MQLSLGELDEAKLHGPKYSIARVYGAGTQGASLLFLGNPAALISGKKAQLYLNI